LDAFDRVESFNNGLQNDFLGQRTFYKEPGCLSWNFNP
jgi:hypothetical protein